MLQIGDTLYTYNENRRRYGEGRTIDRSYHWEEHTITGENRRSWLLSNGLKADKETLEIRGVRDLFGLDPCVYTPEQKADREWRDKYALRIRQAVEQADIPMLRKIAALLGVA